MRKLTLLIGILFLGACSFEGFTGDSGQLSCSIKDQKKFVWQAMQAWYLWNDRLPDTINLKQFATPAEVMAELTKYSPGGPDNPIDNYSYIGSASADAAFYGGGLYQGFGFSWRWVAANDPRLSRVFGGSPADVGGLERGQRIVALNGRSIADIEAAEGIGAVLDTTPVEFTMRETDGVTEFTVTIDQGIVTIDPVPQTFRIPRPVGPDVGYLELSAFVSTADARLDEVFADFVANGVNDLIIDLRYNGGGLVNTSELLGDYLGGDVAENLIFSETRFNANRAADNNRVEFFERLANSMSLSRLVVIASRGTASAAEMVPNSMAPHVDVTIVGDTTYGKPVGQVGLEFCGNIMRPAAFQTFNADGFGDFFDGLPADCAADDDLNVAVGAETDPNIVAALSWLDTGACPAAAATSGQAKPVLPPELQRPDLRGPPWREFASAY